MEDREFQMRKGLWRLFLESDLIRFSVQTVICFIGVLFHYREEPIVVFESNKSGKNQHARLLVLHL